MKLKEAYFEGVRNAITMIESGLEKGLTVKECLDCLKKSIKKTINQK